MRNRPSLFDHDDFEKQSYLETPPVKKTALQTMTLLDKLEQLTSITKGCQLNDDFFRLHCDLIGSVADDLLLTPEETVMLIPFIADSESLIDKSDLMQYFRCSSIKIMRHTEDLRSLLHRRYIIHSQPFPGKMFCYTLSRNAEQAFCNNKGLPVIKTVGLTAKEFISRFHQLVLDIKRRDYIDEEDLLLETMELINGNQQLAIARSLTELTVDDTDKLILLFFCMRLVHDGQVGIPLDQVSPLVDDLGGFANSLIKGDHPFAKKGFLSPLERDSLFNRDVYKLTNKAIKHFLSEYEIPKGKEEEEHEMNHISLIQSSEIKEKQMFYSSEDQHQIDTLCRLLDDKQLRAIRKRLQQANLRKGFNCLFYGNPGTGKTETALQLARMTGRDIMQVDISSIRDKWYGETEKIVQSIFETYAAQVKRAKRIPILLINEADAILSMRTSIGTSNPSLEKTENAIQNILLQAMENIDGIMIATTNLTCNLDPAFDRRFLYKVEFHQPSIEAKTFIWRSFLPDLVEADAVSLAHAYDFSGGQIENIARKVLVDQLLFGNHIELSHIEKLCSQEQIAGRGSHKPIGFNN